MAGPSPAPRCERSMHKSRSNSVCGGAGDAGRAPTTTNPYHPACLRPRSHVDAVAEVEQRIAVVSRAVSADTSFRRRCRAHCDARIHRRLLLQGEATTTTFEQPESDKDAGK